ncbi:DUF2771 family protein [Amycolatopsis sp. PS_44_ISF1]|uniref:DUF2771 family protein n=1 Tax=Amycolatopsis sp. PS_44_ISF1 TaxID=2974917 RepID=UPI0028DEEA70|nr:DUF2771 family protein [Amycolatopsis sp. PS_44_ISF1]MDT8911158.1 DUF2771 domain-containing protein [Amycolatopsis sp. PS_44_ISF1]
MRRSRVVAVLAAGGLAVAGCSAPGPAEVTFYADGHTIRVGPIGNCDVTTGVCSADPGAAGTLKVRPGRSIQVSVPKEVAETPWKITVQYVNGEGRPQPLKEDIITSRDRYAYTAAPPAKDDQIVVVEIAQATVISRTGDPNDAEPITTALWSLQVRPA